MGKSNKMEMVNVSAPSCSACVVLLLFPYCKLGFVFGPGSVTECLIKGKRIQRINVTYAESVLQTMMNG